MGLITWVDFCFKVILKRTKVFKPWPGRLFDHIWRYLELFRAIHSNLKKKWSHLVPFGDIWSCMSYLEPFGALGAIWNNAWPYEGISSNLEPFETIWIHMEIFRAI